MGTIIDKQQVQVFDGWKDSYDPGAKNIFWDAGILKTNAELNVGVFKSSTFGNGIKLDATKSAAFRVYADDGGAVIGSAGTVRAAVFRFLHTNTGQSEAEKFGAVGQYIVVNTTAYHNTAGLMGSWEGQTAVTATGTSGDNIHAGVLGRIGGANLITVSATGVLAGVAAMSNFTTPTITSGGICAGVYVGGWASKTDWQYGICVADSTRVLFGTATATGSAAINAVEITVNDSTTCASGYAHGIHVTYNKSGSTSGGASVTQFNGVGVDYTISGGGSSGYYGLYTYISRSAGNLSAAAVFGANLEVTEMGAVDYIGGLWLNKYNTTLGTIDAFILMSNQGSGDTNTCFYVQGITLPNYLVQLASANGNNFYETGDITNGKSCIGGLRCLFGATVGVLPLYAD